jgi:hypothetical protein
LQNSTVSLDTAKMFMSHTKALRERLHETSTELQALTLKHKAELSQRLEEQAKYRLLHKDFHTKSNQFEQVGLYETNQPTLSLHFHFLIQNNSGGLLQVGQLRVGF